MANLKRIVNINIDIKTPAVSAASFDNLLIIGPAPAILKASPPPLVGSYTDLEGVTDTGWVTTGDKADPVGIAARIAFSQNPQPAKIFIATQQARPALISGGVLKMITSANSAEAIPEGTIQPDQNGLPWLQIAYSREAVQSMSCTIEKDGAVVWGKALPITANPDAYVQVAIGTPAGADEDQMNIAPAAYPGTYTVTLEAVSGDVTSTITRSLTFDGSIITGTSDGTNETVPAYEPIEDTLNRALNTSGWYVICPAGVPESDFETIAEWTEAQIKLFAFTWVGDEYPVTPGIYYRSMGWYGKVTQDQAIEDVPAANLCLHVGAVAKCLAYSSGSETWKFKQLAAITPSEISSTLSDQLDTDHLNYFAEYGGRNITMNGQVMAGEWIDVIRFRDWLQDDMQYRIYNLLIMNTKIPYTNGGIALVENQIIASCKAGQAAGGIAPDEFDSDGYLVPGFTVTVPNSQDLSASQKASRALTGVKFSARLAGAIHVVTVNGELTY